MASPGQTTGYRIITCYILANNIQIVNGDTVSQRSVNKIFDNDFMTCMDKINSDLQYECKTYSEINMSQGKIHICVKNNIYALIQLLKGEIRMDIVSSNTMFNIVEN